MRNTEFPELVKQMKIRKEKLKDIVELLGLTQLSQITRRLSGEIEWTIGEVEILCKHYDMGFWELFRRKEN